MPMYIGLIVLILFIYFIYKEYQFSKLEESKDERGTFIYIRAAKHAFPIFPIGWLLVEVTHRLFTLTFDVYRDLMWVLILSAFIVYGASIQVGRSTR
ncbi:hypothetical protein ACE1TH_06605 [Shouchella sp. JSM 1781072]|uniref:hypothetical protein n=1 Tax=Shouchella sp. JSM 1781072 TaxID=3344581 RepID=UPI0035BF4D97